MTASTDAPAPEHITRTFGPGVTVELSRTLQMRRSELDKYLFELLDQATWIEGIRYLLTDNQVGSGRPWPHYHGEDSAWVSTRCQHEVGRDGEQFGANAWRLPHLLLLSAMTTRSEAPLEGPGPCKSQRRGRGAASNGPVVAGHPGSLGS